MPRPMKMNPERKKAVLDGLEATGAVLRGYAAVVGAEAGSRVSLASDLVSAAVLLERGPANAPKPKRAKVEPKPDATVDDF